MSFDQNIANGMLAWAKRTIDLAGKSKENQPVLIILGGQPGAGKSSMIDHLEDKFNQNIIVLNGDEFKPLYPNYENLLKQDPNKTANIVQPYSNYVVNRLKQEFMQDKYNIIIEGTMRTLKAPLETVEVAKKYNYTVEACIIASNYYASRVGCIKRCEVDISVSSVGRTVAVDSHNEAYNCIPTTIQALIDSNQLDNILVYSRNGEIIADWSNGDDIVKIYLEHRENIPPDLYVEISSHIENATNLKLSRNAQLSEIEDLTNIKYDLYNEYSKQQNQSLILSQINTCKDLLNYYERISPEIVKDAIDTGYVTVHEKGYMPYHVSIEAEPHELAKALALATNNEPHNLTENIENKVLNYYAKINPEYLLY